LAEIDPQRAGELKTLAVENARTATRILAFEAAIRAKDLRRAQTELEQISTESLDRAKLKTELAPAGVQAIADLPAQLGGALSPSCADYNEILAKVRIVQTSHVYAEAIRQVPCTRAQRACHADELTKTAWQEYEAKHHASSLASFEAAY